MTHAHVANINRQTDRRMKKERQKDKKTDRQTEVRYRMDGWMDVKGVPTKAPPQASLPNVGNATAPYNLLCNALKNNTKL